MKTKIWIIVLSAIVLSITIFDQIYIRNSTNAMLSEISSLQISIENNDDADTLLSMLYDIESLWDNRERFLSLLISYNEYSSVNDDIISLRSAITTDNATDMLRFSDLLYQDILFLQNSSIFRLVNVF